MRRRSPEDSPRGIGRSTKAYDNFSVLTIPRVCHIKQGTGVAKATGESAYQYNNRRKPTV